MLARALGISMMLSSVAWAEDGAAGGLEVGATAAGEGSEAMRAGAGALRFAAEGSSTSSDGDLIIASGLVGHAGSGHLGPARGSHWMSLHYDLSRQIRGASKSDYHSWMTLTNRFDYEGRAALSRRRDLARGRYTGGHAQMDTALFGGGSETEGGAFIMFTWDLDYVDTIEGPGTDVLHRIRPTLFQWWTDGDRDGVRHVREALTFDSYAGDYEKQAISTTFIVYTERDRPLVGGLRADFRVGFASNAGTTTIDEQEFVNERHPDVTCGILDGALRLPVGGTLLEVRYDRNQYLTVDALLALEDRATARATWTAGRWNLGADAFTARTGLWRERHMPGTYNRTDGVAGRATLTWGGFITDLAVEAGHSFYAAPDAAAMAPAPGWRASVDISRRWGGSRQSAPALR